MSKTEPRIVTGRCPSHGIVEATRDVPKVSFPFIVYGIRRAKAALTPAQCPQCGAKLGRS